MTPTLVKNFILLCISVLIALVFGFAVSVQSYELLVLPVILILLAATIVLPGYGFLLAFGLMCPFILPLPFVWGMPTLLFILGLCGLKFILRRALGRDRLTITYCVPVAVYFGWILVRYCMNPVTPGLALGLSEGISGFRAYVNYGLCALVFMAVGMFRTDKEVARLLQWMCGLSAILICIFLPLVFTKSLFVASFLTNLGVFVTAFDNGWLRFVILPDFGLMLIMAAALPNLFSLRKSWRIAAFIMGIVAIIFGGNRSSILMLFAVFVILSFIRYRIAGLLASAVGVGLCVAAMFYIGEAEVNVPAALYRVTALVSPHAARVTNAEQTVEWRKVRWERAMDDIREHPWIGMSYGGLENAFVFANSADYERARVDIDVVSGTIHNGYLANARAFGIPCLLLFIYILGATTVRSAIKAIRFKSVNVVQSEFQAFVWMNLVALAISVYIGADINSTRLWFILGLAYWSPYSSVAKPAQRSAAVSVPIEAVPA